MYILIHKLEQLVAEYSSIAIYGTGTYAQEIYSVLCKLGYQEKIIKFIVSKMPVDNVFADKEVVSIDDFHGDSEECLIFVAVSEIYKAEIKKMLEERNFLQVAYMTNYVRIDSDEEKAELFRGASFEGYCKFISDWYIYEHIEQKDRYEAIINQLLETGRCHEKTSGEGNVISMIVGIITGRTVKLAKAFRKKGYEVVVIQLQRGIPYVGESELLSYGIDLEKCYCIEEILYKALQRKPLVFYIDAPHANASIAEIMLRHKEKFGKIVFTAYDICHGTYVGKPELYYSSERYALENADGIIWRFYSEEFIRETFGIQYQGKSIQFADCCDDYNLGMVEKKESIVKICSIPTHVSEGLKEKPVSEYMYESTLEEILQKLGNRRDCCYHVFYWNATDEQKMQLEELQKKYSNFKVFYHVEHLKLMKILSQYDYGCSLWSGSKIPKWPQPEDSAKKIAHSEGLFRYGMTNKFFDFISVGLPIISTFPEVLADNLEKKKVLIKMNLESFDLEYLKKHKEEYRLNVQQVRDKFLVDNQIYKLIDFFNQVSCTEMVK